MKKTIRFFIITIIAITIGVVVNEIFGKYGIGAAAGLAASVYELRFAE